MGKSKIDPIIQGKLYNLATPLDKGALWAALESEIAQPQHGRKNGLIAWCFGGLICAAIGLYGLGLYNQSSTYLSQNASGPQGQTPHEVQSAIVSDNEVSKAKQETNQADLTVSTSSNNRKLQETVQQGVTNIPTTKRIRRAEKETQILKSPTKPQTTKALPVITGPKPPVSTPANLNETINQAKSPGIVTSNREHKDEQNTPKVINGVSSLGRVDLTQFYTTSNLPDLDMKQAKIKRVDCYDYNYTYSPLSIMAYYGPGVSKRWMSNKESGTESDIHFNLRESHESTLEGHRAGALLKFKVKSGFFLKAGLEVANINEKLEYESSVEEAITIENTIIRYEILPDGTEVPVYGDIQGTIITNKKWLYYNQYRFIDVPVLVGYEFRTNRWNVAVEGGVLINQSMRFSDGETSDPGSTFGMVSGEPELSGDYYKSRTGLALQLGGGLGYSLSKSVTLWATPSLRHGLGSIGANDYELNQNYTSVNVLLGAELKF